MSNRNQSVGTLHEATAGEIDDRLVVWCPLCVQFSRNWLLGLWSTFGLVRKITFRSFERVRLSN